MNHNKSLPTTLFIRIIIFFTVITLSVTFLSAATTKCWDFHFTPVFYNSGWGQDTVSYEVKADISIERVADTIIYSQHYRKVVFNLLKVSPFDTTVFGTYTNLASYDTLVFPLHPLDSFQIGDSSLTPGDTLKDLFIHIQTYRKGVQDGFAMSKSCFLSDSNPPFPVSQALATYNQYLNANKIYKGYNPPPSGLLLIGPVFIFVFGDVGWSLTVHYDSTAWYFQQHAGDGDCPMGCTGGMDATYRILANGFIERVACTSYSSFSWIDYCAPSSIKSDIKARPFISSFKGDLHIYSLSGKYCGKVQSLPLKKGGSDMARLNLKPGAYIIRPEIKNYDPFLYTIIP